MSRHPDGPKAPADPVIAFEAALARRDWETARDLTGRQPDPSAADRRIWNLVAFGEDTTAEFTLDRLQSASQAAVEKVRDVIWAEHKGLRSCASVNAYLRDPSIGGARVHGRDLPWLAYYLVTYECLTRDETHRFLAEAWKSAEYPEFAIGTEAWRVIFAHADGLVTDLDADEQRETPPVPSEPVRLYRGAITSRAAGMSWTGDQARAEWFADRWNGRLDDTAHVWTAVVEPERILARFVRRNEDEYVVVTEGLDIERADR